MVFEPVIETARWLIALLPTSLKFGKPKLNFITVHYLYMIGLTIAGSIMLYPAGGMAYIDAFFFAAGSATQSGLNTLNVNELLLYQQVVLMLIACIANPIFINTMVVFVRLYWFEKRFERLVKDIRSQRRSRTTSFARSFSKGRSNTLNADDPNRLERGVNGRQIRVLHETTTPSGMNGLAVDKDAQLEFAEKLAFKDSSGDASTPSGASNQGSDHTGENASHEEPTKDSEELPHVREAQRVGVNPKMHREITFADEVPDLHLLNKVPGPSHTIEHTASSQHIRFLERQQRDASQESGTLHIPGPRDFDNGEKPKMLEDDSNENGLVHPRTQTTVQSTDSETERANVRINHSEEISRDDQPHRAITINEPDHPGHSEPGGRNLDRDRHVTSSSRFGADRVSVLNMLRSRSRGGLALKDSHNGRAKTIGSITSARTQDHATDTMPYLSWQATTGRNSAFFGLTEEQREELGGIEYRSLKTLAKILMLFFIGFHVLGMMILTPWIMHTEGWRSYVISGGVNPAWWGVFTPASMFNDLGFTLTPDSMNSFETAILPLLFGSFLILIGNTGFPIMLRFVIWIASIFTPTGSGVWEEVKFLLDHPRRCFTLLFPSSATWWLFWVLILLNGIDLVFFIILDLNDSVVTDLGPGYRVLNGWFQATSTRTAGFSCVNLAALHPAIQVSYLIMMYISALPIAISVRRTNVYEEKSLGIWGGEENEDAQASYVGQHLRRQLSFDLWYIFLGFFIISIVEGARLQDVSEYSFTMFNVLFEIVSAYGTVGLSLGYPGIDASFSAEFAVISKLVIVAMMIRGRHRGLPYALDRAILLPSEHLHKKEMEEANRRHEARRTSMHEREQSWEEGDWDSSGLPGSDLEHDGDPMTAGAGGERGPEHVGLPRRRSSMRTTASAEARKRPGRARSIATIIAGGLSAGPTWSKHE